MINISKKRLEQLHEDISKELSESKRQLSLAKSLLEKIEEETTAKRHLKFAVERIIEIKEEQEEN